MKLSIQKKSGVVIYFETDITSDQARSIVLDAFRAGRNVGDFAMSLASQRRALTCNQEAWLIYLAMEITGQLRKQVREGPWAWLLKCEPLTKPDYRIVSASDGSPCRFLMLKRAEWLRFTRQPRFVNVADDWRYVGHFDAFGGFHFGRDFLQQVTGEGRGALEIKFPEEEQLVRDEAKWLQSKAVQILEALKNASARSGSGL